MNTESTPKCTWNFFVALVWMATCFSCPSLFADEPTEPLLHLKTKSTLKDLQLAAANLKDTTSFDPTQFQNNTSLREWTDKTGQFTLKATFHNFKTDTIILRKVDKSLIEIKLEDLSQNDLTVLKAIRAGINIVGTSIESKSTPQKPKANLKPRENPPQNGIKLPNFNSLVLSNIARLEITQGPARSLRVSGNKEMLAFSVNNGTLFLGLKLPPNTLISNGRLSNVTINGRQIVVPGGSVSVSGNRVSINGITIDPNQPINIIDPPNPLSLSLTVPDLDQLALSDRSTIAFNGFKTDRLRILVKGTGQVAVSGIIAGRLLVNASDTGRALISGEVTELDARSKNTGNIDASRLRAGTVTAQVEDAAQARVFALNALDAEISDTGKLYYSGSPMVTEFIEDLGKIIKVN